VWTHGFVQEAGQLVCIQEKLKQLQADVDYVLQYCCGDSKAGTKAGKNNTDGTCGGQEVPKCDDLQVSNYNSRVFHCGSAKQVSNKNN